MTDARARSGSGRHGLAAAATVSTVLLAAILTGRLLLHSESADMTQRHARVRELIESVPMNIGPWRGEDIPVPTGAVKLLRPNKILSRRYEHETSGQGASLLVVHCADSRDLLGHYPPACYAGIGWRLAGTSPWSRTLGELDLKGTRYEFASQRGPWTARMTIDGMLITPMGTFAGDMGEVDRASQGAYRRHGGAAQIHIVYDSLATEEDRMLAFEEIVGSLEGLLTALLRPNSDGPSEGEEP